MAETKSAHIFLRVQPWLKSAAEKASKDDNRTLTGYIEKLLTDAMKKSGHLKQGGKK